MKNPTATTISAMDLRREPGRVLDQLRDRGQRFIVVRAGGPKAVIVPVREFEQMERSKVEARQQLVELIEQACQNITETGIGEDELQQEIDTAVAEVRADRRASQFQPASESGR